MATITHHTLTADGRAWHWAEAGEGDVVVLLHGIPESWKCWKHQIPCLATQFRVLAFDLIGYGLSDKADGDYSGTAIAKSLLAVLDELKIDRFRLAGHDWGVLIGDHVVNQAPQRVEQYVRCCLSLHVYDPRNSLHHQWISEQPQAASALMRKTAAYVRVWFDSSCKSELLPPDEELAELIADFSHPGIAEAVPRYFRDLRRAAPVDYTRFTMPVLCVHGEHDPRQPIEYCRALEDHLPGLEAVLVLDSGHFVTRERPLAITQAMMWFFNYMLASGSPLFDRSRHYGLPTKPTQPQEAWGVNAFRAPQASTSSANRAKPYKPAQSQGGDNDDKTATTHHQGREDAAPSRS